jgi:hypothetical protein
LCYEPAGAALERKAQHRALLIVDIILREREKLAVACQAGDDADVPSIEAY